MSGEAFDIIGDVHGQAWKLLGLLEILGYRRIDGVWEHPERKAIFVGDLIDRGPRQLETINIVRPMVEFRLGPMRPRQPRIQRHSLGDAASRRAGRTSAQPKAGEQSRAT